MNYRLTLAAALFAASSLLAACGGGGGGGGNPISGPPPTLAPTSTPTSTTAQGTLVDDPSGNALAGIPVKLEPWSAGATPLPSPQTTTAADGSFSFTAPNGHYLLVIGSDSTSDTTRPTIHDNITLTGGTVVLKAPTLPSEPIDSRTAVETSGKYRLATLDATTEVPCFNAFNSQRASLALGPTVADEWLTENARNLNAYRANPAFNVNNAGTVITTGTVVIAGGTSCTGVMGLAMTTNPTYTKDPRTLWFGGNYIASSSGTGVFEVPIDPRATPDPNYPNWP